MRMLVYAVIVGCAAVLLGRAVHADEPSRPCAADVRKFCPDVPVGAGRILACLESHSSELSSECQQDLRGRKQRNQKRREAIQANKPWITACSGDIRTHCHAVPAGAGRIRECLHAHESSLSDACKSMLNATPTH
jgi:hypothetical protein